MFVFEREKCEFIQVNAIFYLLKNSEYFLKHVVICKINKSFLSLYENTMKDN